ncbi:MAG: phosphoglycerate dehydrogenase-like enzyme [Candidatus Latescibacterota bacterium]|jgi:phosphoglycerate dehydrogenase-like enzyme
MSGTILFARNSNLERSWPFVAEALMARLNAIGETRVVDVERGTPISEVTRLSDVTAIAMFGGKLSEACVAGAPNLKAVGGVLDIGGHRNMPVDLMFERGISIVDATRAWAPSVAECTLTLALNALRMIPQWHKRMAAGERLWNYKYAQFCDNPNFVNGTLGTKTVGVMGLGQIGGRVALWCRALGSRVLGYDPFISKEKLDELGVESVEMDDLVDACDVVFVTIPPTPSAEKILSRERIGRLKKGALVVITTRAHAVDMAALRERIYADELMGAFDVYDVEPLPEDDLLRNRPNVVHTPHIAGRTRDANLMVAEVIADDFERILKGEAPHSRLSREAIAVREERKDLPKMG